jgi:hypothetical protein
MKRTSLVALLLSLALSPPVSLIVASILEHGDRLPYHSWPSKSRFRSTFWKMGSGC